jgi:hypothetical protein
MRRPAASVVRRLGGGALAMIVCACGQGFQPPTDTGVCFHMVTNGKGEVGGQVSGKYRFFVLKRDVPDLEHCAAALDAMRVHFLSLGGSSHDVTGVYQGEYLFVGSRGVFSADSLDASPFPMLTRAPDGRLVPQGSLPPT